jgi:hypothetical protein
MSPASHVNDVLKAYCTSAEVADWEHGDAARDLHAWAGRFNDTFDLGLATPVIVLDRLRARAAAYHVGRNALGLMHEVRVNSKGLVQPLAFRLVELLRELLKEKENLHGRPCRGRYCTAVLREEARLLGLRFDRYGHLAGVEPGSFTQLLRRYAVEVGVLLEPPRTGSPQGMGRMKKWDCGWLHHHSLCDSGSGGVPGVRR